MFLLGTIIESVTKTYRHGRCGGSFTRRTRFLEEQKLIDSTLREDIDWLWDIRNNLHLFKLKTIEWSSDDYTIANHNRAVRAFRKLLTALGRS
ncbi:MAG: hypothetical protein LW847_00385 [Burkholderiales bacterium]|nr:hypothetical protein [Burkholderiales bacterium]